MKSEYSTIRGYLGPFVGRRLIDITQHDKDEYREDGSHYVCLMFEGGATLTFHLPESIDWEIDE